MFEILIDSIVFIDFVTRKRITQILTTLNVKKSKLKKSNNFKTIKTKKKETIIKKIMKKKLRYKKHQTKFNLNSKKSRKTKK